MTILDCIFLITFNTLLPSPEKFEDKSSIEHLCLGILWTCIQHLGCVCVCVCVSVCVCFFLFSSMERESWSFPVSLSTTRECTSVSPRTTGASSMPTLSCESLVSQWSSKQFWGLISWTWGQQWPSINQRNNPFFSLCSNIRVQPNEEAASRG